MRLTPVRFSRSIRPRKVQAWERNVECSRMWSRQTAQVIELVLKNEAPLPWSSLEKYRQMPPVPQDVIPLLPLLEKRAVTEFYRSTKGKEGAYGKDAIGLETVGQFALSLDLLSQLSNQFTDCWIRQLAMRDPYQALQVYKRAKNMPAELGVELYLAAGQPHKAADLSERIENLPFKLIRKFTEYHVKLKDSVQAQAWLDKWQSPRPEDIRWLHHIANNYQLNLRMPPLPTNESVPARPHQVAPKLQIFVGHLNELLATHPGLLQDELIYTKWKSAMGSPSQNSLKELALAISGRNVVVNWMVAIRALDMDCVIEFVSLISPSSREYASLISRSNATQLSSILEQIPPEFLYTSECLCSLAASHPHLFSELVVPQELLDVQFKDHQLLAIWQSKPPAPLVSWLHPLTLSRRSPRLLRGAIQSLVSLGDRAKVESLLVDFIITQNLMFDPKILKAGKLSRARTHHYSKEDSEKQVNDILSTLFT